MRAVLIFALAVMAAPCNAETSIEIDKAVPTVLVPATPVGPNDSWVNSGPRTYEPHYEVYVPKEIKSDNPEAVRAYSASALPHNGNGQTPEGLACATSADCTPPLACFDRADSGKVPVRICALPPAP